VLNQTPCREDVLVVQVWLQAFLTSAVEGDEWSASQPGRFTLGESPRYPLDMRLGGSRSRSGSGGEEKNSHITN